MWARGSSAGHSGVPSSCGQTGSVRTLKQRAFPSALFVSCLSLLPMRPTCLSQLPQSREEPLRPQGGPRGTSSLGPSPTCATLTLGRLVPRTLVGAASAHLPAPNGLQVGRAALHSLSVPQAQAPISKKMPPAGSLRCTPLPVRHMGHASSSFDQIHLSLCTWSPQSKFSTNGGKQSSLFARRSFNCGIFSFLF